MKTRSFPQRMRTVLSSPFVAARAPSPRARGEGGVRGRLRWHRQLKRPLTRRAARVDLSPRAGRGHKKSVPRRAPRPSFANRHDNHALLDSPPAQKREAKRRKAQANHSPRITGAAARQNRGALAFRRFTAALASAVATASGSAPEPRFLRQRPAGVLPASALSS